MPSHHHQVHCLSTKQRVDNPCPNQLMDCFDKHGGINSVRLLHYQWSKSKQLLQGLQDINGPKHCILHKLSNADMYRKTPHDPKKASMHNKDKQANFDGTGNNVPCNPKTFALVCHVYEPPR